MKALDNVKTDDLSEEQKRLLSELIKNEMLQKIEGAINDGTVQLADTIRTYIKQDKEKEEEEKALQTPPPKAK
jgi:acyl-CoA reductase-like NAD-dependent aldehyde dehydrogenase